MSVDHAKLAESMCRNLVLAKKRPLVFLHTPKTAGTTLHKILDHQFSPREILLTDVSDGERVYARMRDVSSSQGRTVRLIMGHIYASIRAGLPPDCIFLSMVRHPVDRLISHFHYSRTTPSHYLHEKVVRERMNIAEYVTSGLSGEMENSQTKILAGVQDPRATHVTDAIYLQAIENMRTCFCWVGITEAFDRSLLVLAKGLGWKTPFYVRRKVNHANPGRSGVTPEQIAVIEECNRYDIMLFQVVCDVMDRMAETLLSNEEEEVETFRRMNARIGAHVFRWREARRRVSCAVLGRSTVLVKLN